MSELRVEDYALWFTFFMGGIYMIANTASVMCKSIFKLLYLTQSTHLNESSHPQQSPVPPLQQNSVCDHEKVSTGNSDEHIYLKNRHASLVALCNSSDHKIKPESSSSKSASTCAINGNNAYLARLLFFSCVLETICITLSELMLTTNGNEQLSTCCNSTIQTEDCIAFNAVVVLQKQCVHMFLCTLVISALLAFPVSFLFTNHCFTDWTRRTISSVIFVFAILLSRCFGFLFLPHLLQGPMPSFLFQRSVICV